MEAKHTPGPWWWHKNPHTAGPFSHFITDDPTLSEDGEFAEVASVVFSNEADANARLIAAAPDLLAALEAAERRLTACARAFYGDGKRSSLAAAFEGWKADIEPARAAIAKATGGAR